MDYSLPGSSVHGIFQARVLEWVAIAFFRGSSQPRDRTQVSHIVSRRFYHLSHQGSLFFTFSSKRRSFKKEGSRGQCGPGSQAVCFMDWACCLLWVAVVWQEWRRPLPPEVYSRHYSSPWWTQICHRITAIKKDQTHTHTQNQLKFMKML